MKTCQHIIAIVVSAALAGTMNAAHADETAALTHEILVMDTAVGNHGSGTVTNKIAADFQTFAGSRTNATALVTGLREGSPVTLTQPSQRTATFTPPTGHMGYGNVSTSLALARYQLAQQGIANPTPLQLKIALTGGTIVANGQPVVYDGILQMRADGLGWGQIAHQLGTKLGPVVSGIKAQNTNIASTHRASPPVTTSTVTTGATTTAPQPRPGNAHAAGKGIVNAGGASAAATGKKDDAGPSTATGKSSAPGRGMVTAAGQSVGAGSPGGGNGKAAHGAVSTAGSGVVTGSGAVTAAGAGAGNGGQGHGKALGHSK